MTTSRPLVDEPRMSGALVLEHRRILEEICGKERFARVRERLDHDIRAEYDEIRAISWPRVRTAEAVIAAAAEELRYDPVALHERVSRAAVDRTLTGVWKLLLRFTSDEALVARTPRIYARALNRGELVPRMIGRGRAEIRVIGWPDIPEFSVRGVRIAIERVLVLAGRSNVRVQTERDATGPRFLATWRA